MSINTRPNPHKKNEPDHRTCQPKDHKKGFSFIECLVSFSIVTFLILGTSQLLLHSLIVQKRSNFNAASAQLTISKLEYFKSLPFDSSELSEGSQTKNIKEKNSRAIFQMKWKIQDISQSLKKIEFECFSETCPEKKTHLVLFISKKLGF